MIFTQNKKPASNYCLSINKADSNSEFNQNGILMQKDEMTETILFAANNGLNFVYFSGNCPVSVKCVSTALNILEKKKDIVLSVSFDFNDRNNLCSTDKFKNDLNSLMWSLRVFFIDIIMLHCNEEDSMCFLSKTNGILDLLAEIRYENVIGKFGLESNNTNLIHTFKKSGLGDLIFLPSEITKEDKGITGTIFAIDKKKRPIESFSADNTTSVSLFHLNQILSVVNPITPVNELVKNGYASSSFNLK